MYKVSKVLKHNGQVVKSELISESELLETIETAIKKYPLQYVLSNLRYRPKQKVYRAQDGKFTSIKQLALRDYSLVKFLLVDSEFWAMGKLALLETWDFTIAIEYLKDAE